MPVERERKNGVGLGRLSPGLRLAVVFTAGILFVFINTITAALVLLAVGLGLFLANKTRDWKLAASAPLSGGLMLFYNTILSPGAGGYHWWIFTINAAGFDRGLVTGLRLAGVMLLSFAWLGSTPLPEIYQSLAWFRPGETWTLGILRGVQIIKREVVALTQSLLIRGLRWDSVIANIRNLVPLGVAIIPRIIDNAQKATFASQSHRRCAPNDDGTIMVEDLHVRYGADFPDVLRGIDLAVPSGEFLYLAGKNAAGKTTLLRTLGGVIPRVMGEFRGRVVVSGMATHEVPLAVLTGSARYVAPDPFASIHGLTVGQEISFLAADERAARQALEIMGLANLWDRETTKLSGGQQVRLVLAGALASEARIFLLDAPMQELDPEGRVAFMEALAILRSRRPCTIVVADPFWQDLASYTHRVMVLEGGRLLPPLASAEFFSDTWLARCNLQVREGAAAPHLIPLSLQGEGQRVRGSDSLGDIVAALEGVHVALEGTQILHGVDFAVREGELVAIMGPNGSGKTTAMLTLAGAIRPQKGTVTTRGRVGYVFQHAQLQTVGMTVDEELAFGPKVLRWPEQRTMAFVAEGLAWTGLSRDASPIDLHPADVRMLMIAACNTDLSTLVLDEPTIGLDSVGIEKVMELMKVLLREGKAVVIITHDESIAAQAHRVVTIRDGRVEGIRTPTRSSPLPALPG